LIDSLIANKSVHLEFAADIQNFMSPWLSPEIEAIEFTQGIGLALIGGNQRFVIAAPTWRLYRVRPQPGRILSITELLQ
jgi:hypothetical protein